MMSLNEQRPGIGKTNALLSSYRRHWWQLWKPKFPGLNVVTTMKAEAPDLMGFLTPNRQLEMHEFMHEFFAPAPPEPLRTFEQMDIVVADDLSMHIWREGEADGGRTVYPVIMVEDSRDDEAMELRLAHHEVVALHQWLTIYLNDYPKE